MLQIQDEGQKVSLNIESIGQRMRYIVRIPFWCHIFYSDILRDRGTIETFSSNRSCWVWLNWTIFGWKNYPGHCIILLLVIVISAGCTIVRLLFNLTARKNKFEVIMMTVDEKTSDNERRKFHVLPMTRPVCNHATALVPLPKWNKKVLSHFLLGCGLLTSWHKIILALFLHWIMISSPLPFHLSDCQLQVARR